AGGRVELIFVVKEKTAYEIGLGIPAEPLFRSSCACSFSFSVKVLNLFSRSRRKTNKRKSKHSAMLRNKETRHRMFIGLLNTTRRSEERRVGKERRSRWELDEEEERGRAIRNKR